MCGLKFCKRSIKKSPTRPATFGEFNSKPAGVSRMAIRKGRENCLAIISKTLPPANDVSPEPSKARWTQVVLHQRFLSNNSRTVFQT